MQSRVGISQIKPLSHPDGDGEEFKRSPQVEAQILEALSLSPAYLQERVAIGDFQQYGYLKEECVVYLIRELRSSGEFSLADELIRHLALRIAKRVHRQISKSLNESFVVECFNDVISEVTCRILNLKSDADDYAQVRFGRWLKLLTFKLMRPYFEAQKRARISDSDSELREDQKTRKKEPADTRTLSPEKTLLNKEALNLLVGIDPMKRTAYILRHAENWEIVAISKFLGRSTKTISKWLKEVQAELRISQ
jgi:DNA-directed RNA polymerase specialized sigma24 family protein